MKLHPAVLCTATACAAFLACSVGAHAVAEPPPSAVRSVVVDAGAAEAEAAAPAPPARAAFDGPGPDLASVCGHGPPPVVAKAAKIPPDSQGRLRAVQVVFCRVASTFGPALTDRDYYLVVQTPKGWFSKHLGYDGLLCGFDQPVSVRFEPGDLAVRVNRIVLQASVGGIDGATPDGKGSTALCCAAGDAGELTCGC